MKQEMSAGGIIYIEEKKQINFLLIKSSYWGFPKGAIEQNETPEKAAKREIKEETNLEVRFIPGFFYKQDWFYKMNNELIKKNATFFIAKIPIEDAIKVRIANKHTGLSEEHTAYQWVTYEEALKLIKIKSNRDMLNTAYNFIREFEAQKRLM